MKKLAINLLAMGITSLGLAQNSYPTFDDAFIKELALRSNYVYLKEVQNHFTPVQVQYLENVVSYWDIAQAPEFEHGMQYPFIATFKAKLGQITANYDNKGRIIMTEERFENVALPRPVYIAITKKYPNWSIVKNKYSLLYSKGSGPKKRFKVKIAKDGQNKWLKVYPSGKIS